MYLLFAVILILTSLYWYLTKNYTYWERQNVPVYESKLWPGIGHTLPLIRFKESFQSFCFKLYNSSDASMVGLYFLGKPGLLVRDPELVKSVTVTNFGNFKNNLRTIGEREDPIMGRNPFFAATVETWKNTRQQTARQLSGKKLKNVCEIVKHVCAKMTDYMEGRTGSNGSFECELKEHFTRYTGEIVANTVFAIEGQSFEDRPDPLSFTVLSEDALKAGFFNGIKRPILHFAPGIANFFGLTFFGAKAEKFFRDNVRAKLVERSKMDVPPNDFLQLIVEANPDGNFNNIVADVITFHIDVYETTSVALSVIFHLLSLHKDVQEKLREQIQTKLGETCGDVTYECLKDMEYLDQVINESLRMITPLSMLMKVCTTDTILEGSDGVKAHVKEGQPVLVSAWGLHKDSNYWPGLDKFDPDRFSLDNEAGRPKYTFMPFGEGPRMCVGIRLAVMIMKMAIVKLLVEYSVEYSPKTKVPLEFLTTTVFAYVKGGLWAKFKRLSRTC